MLGLLKEKGWTPSATDDAQVVIVNTCGFIREAKEESIETILNLAAAKEGGRVQKLVVTGCLPQRYGRELLRELPEVDFFVGTGEFHRIADLLDRSAGEYSAGNNGSTLLNSSTIIDPPASILLPRQHLPEGLRGMRELLLLLRNPRIRGRLRSRPISSILKEAEQAASRGVKEINLIAQDITAYGKDRKDGASLVRLLKGLAKVEGIRWIRLLYAHPARLTEEMVHVIRDEEKVCKYLDLPIQHVDEGILKAMNRPPLKKRIPDLIDWIRREIPGVILRTSLIVGFPGETERSFRRLLEFVREAQFDRLGVFSYSPEEGTPAAALKDQVQDRIKLSRSRQIMRLQKKISLKKQKAFLGSQVQVLVERPGGSPNLLWEGRTPGQAPEVDGVTFLTKGRARAGIW